MVENVGSGTEFHNLAAVENSKIVGEIGDGCQIVADNQNRGMFVLVVFIQQFEDLQAAVVRDDAGKQKLRITGYEVIDADSALLSFEGEVALTFTGAVVPQYIYAEDGSVSDVQFRTADISRTVSLSGWTDILGKFAEDDSIDFVEDLNDLEFDTETGGMVIDITDGNADISYYE